MGPGVTERFSSRGCAFGDYDNDGDLDVPVLTKMIGANPDASVVYYGAPPPLDWVRKIKAPILLNYADPQKDTRLGGLLPGYEKALIAAKIKYTLYTYEGANHAFNDDTQQARYNEAAAQLAWERTLSFLKSHLA